MDHFMHRTKLMKLIDDCLETSYDFKVTRDTSNDCDELFKLEVRLGDDTWVPIVPTYDKPAESEPANQHYTVIYGCDAERGYYATFIAQDGHVKSELSEIDLESEEYIYLTGLVESSFCTDNEIECFDLYKKLDWTPWGDQPFFCKIKNSWQRPVPSRVPRVTQCCGRVLRDWESMCPNCDTELVYPG